MRVWLMLGVVGFLGGCCATVAGNRDSGSPDTQIDPGIDPSADPTFDPTADPIADRTPDLRTNPTPDIPLDVLPEISTDIPLEIPTVDGGLFCTDHSQCTVLGECCLLVPCFSSMGICGAGEIDPILGCCL